MNLYYLQDSDRPLWVVAEDWTAALQKWRKLVKEENDDNDAPDVEYQPQGIQLVCETDDLLL